MMRRTPIARKTPMKRSAMKRITPMNQDAAILKRSPMKKATKKPRTTKIKKHMSAVADLGCVVCRNLGYGKTPAELHHPRFLAGGGQKSSDDDVIPLCPNHHRLGGYGIAYHAGAKEWERRYGTEEILLEQTRLEMATKERK